MSGRNALLRSVAAVGFLGAGARLMAAVAGILLAHSFGASASTDAYLLAKTLPVGLYLILDSVLYNTLVPLFRREEQARSLARAATWIVLGLGLLLSAALWFGAPFWMALLAPGAGEATREHAAALQRLSAWAIVFAAPTSCLKAWNASQDRYLAASLDGIFLSGLLLAALVLAPATMGVVPITVALPAAFLLLLALQIFLARGMLLPFSGRVPLSALPWRDVRRPILPLLALNGAQQAQVWIVVMLAVGFGAGSVSQVHYSYGIAQIPVGVIDLVLFSTFFPFAAGLAAHDDHGRLARAFQGAAAALALLCVPLALWMVLSRQVLVEALLLRGVFSAEDARLTATLLIGHALAIPGWCLEALGCRTLFALDRHATYLGVVIFRLLLFLALSALLLPLLGLAGLSVAFAGAFTASALVAVFLLFKRFPSPGPGFPVKPCWFGVVLAVSSGVTAAGFWGTQLFLERAGLDHPVAVLLGGGAVVASVLACVLIGFMRRTAAS